MDGQLSLSPGQFTNLGASGALSSSSLVLPSSLEQKSPKLPDIQRLSVEMEVSGDPQPSYSNSFSSNTGLVGHMISSSSSYSTELQFSSAHQDKDAYTAQYTTTSSLQLSHSANSDSVQFAASSHGSEGNISFRWCSALTSDFQDFRTEPSPQKSHLNSCNGGMGGALLQEDCVGQNDWRNWADNLITEEEALTSSLNDLLVDVSFADHKPKMSNQVPKQPTNCVSEQMQCEQKLSLSTSQVNTSVSPSSSSAGPAIKHHMRWTPELHDAFVEAINKLGGSERATPNGVLKLMKVDGLTIYHVKSHLQKYRTARYMPESKNGASEKKSSSIPDSLNLDYKGGMDITEALRLQMQVQKKLHEQLEIQRNLQLQLEEQGKYLQLMFEKQSKSGSNKLKASSKREEEPSRKTPEALHSSHVKNEQETSPGQDEESGDKELRHGTSASKSTMKTFFAVADKDKRPRKDDLFSNQPSKLAKVDNPTLPSSD